MTSKYDYRTTRDLFLAWVHRLANDRLALPETRETSPRGKPTNHRFGNSVGQQFILEAGPNTPIEKFQLHDVTGLAMDAVQQVINEACAHAGAGELGGELLYEIEMTCSGVKLDRLLGTHFFRVLGDQVRIIGARRIGRNAILRFTEEPDEQELFAPQTKIQAELWVPSPAPGPLATRGFTRIVELTASACAFALGRVVDCVPISMPVVPDDPVLPEATERRDDPNILTLARNSVSLDVFDLVSRGGLDGAERVRRALLSYHAALQQVSAEVAAMLFISSLEALIAPGQSWRKEKLTLRFITAVEELCRPELDELLKEPTLDEILDAKVEGKAADKRRRNLLDRLYEVRSQPTHTGLGGPEASFPSLDVPDTLRVMHLSNLTRAGILAYLQSPRSSLVGHPLHTAQAAVGVDPAGAAVLAAGEVPE